LGNGKVGITFLPPAFLKISCGAAIAVQKITGLTLNLQDSLVYSYKPPNPSGRPEEGREPVNQYPDLFP
jgi:hypothetical protein